MATKEQTDKADAPAGNGPVTITFVGGPNDGNVGSNEWGGGPNGMSLKFEKNVPMTIDPTDDATWNGEQVKFLRHVIMKARSNPHFELSEGDDPHKRTRGRGPQTREDIEALTKDELAALADKRKVYVTTSMTKAEIVDALLAG